MKWNLLLLFLFSCNYGLFAQNHQTAVKLLNISIGPNFSNFMHSEAPHKINIYGSDVNPANLSNLDISKSLGYFDYETSLIQDIKIDLTIGLGYEAYLKNDLSILFSIKYEGKGLDLRNYKHESTVFVPRQKPPGSLPLPEPSDKIAYYDEIFEVKINNKYIVIPVLLRKHLNYRGVYIQGGFYTGLLLKSQISSHLRKHAYIRNYDFYGYDLESNIDIADDKKEFTMNIDFGLSLGTGFSYALSERLFFNTDLVLNAGLRKIDKKYNNEYEEKQIAGTSGISTSLRSTNYYGLNSNSKNISSAITLGIGYKL